MSIDATYIQLTNDEFKSLVGQPFLVMKFFGDGYNDPPVQEYFDYYEQMLKENRVWLLHSKWQAVFYLLTQEVIDNQKHSQSVLSSLFFGKHFIQHPGYEQVTYLTPKEVKEFVPELELLEPADVRAAFLKSPRQSVNLYHCSSPSEWSEFELQYLIKLYTGLRDLYLRAADINGAMLISVG